MPPWISKACLPELMRAHQTLRVSYAKPSLRWILKPVRLKRSRIRTLDTHPTLCGLGKVGVRDMKLAKKIQHWPGVVLSTPHLRHEWAANDGVNGSMIYGVNLHLIYAIYTSFTSFAAPRF